MFTGIIEEIGEVKFLEKNDKSYKVSIKCKKVLEDVDIGDSISTNGVCLTLIAKEKDFFSAYIMKETLDKSNLTYLDIGSKVNLERAMKVNDRFNGHIVSGHIDSMAEIINFRREDKTTWITLKATKETSKYMVYKGSIAIDGISLTIARLKGETFEISLIPHSQNETTLLRKAIGEKVNIECDILAKYLEKLYFCKDINEESSKISKGFLSENGFM
ncbi:riboflavin synthase [Clostridium septicum]|uniref:Riboflavin synthase n=1 Tax=Clostridium septicum TaxID=1504 RepID=A0A9N7JP63_CLOSE|nr:riboflavin synthase [Clostridium septicum]AYE35466.1 riboflavin synthase [Clostridium septicum]MDU1314121.1 riboflavin synthase [Clostridium septicum]QAS60854.1 riboflavin synthase [Clostridium septicum]UEC19878.1 riboflavin synthase [Clostridium septicum]USS02062.1 riboflavin synthase [Clostridium septicum]